MLQKTNAVINFAQGLDTKTDDKQVALGKFLSLKNSVFTRGGRLTKRNGFGPLSSLPNSNSTFLTTFNGNLTAIGTNLEAYSQANNSWLNKGTLTPASLDTLPAVRSALNQGQCDSVVSSAGLVCAVYTEQNNGSDSYKYIIKDMVTGQNIVAPTVIPVASGALVGSPRVFLLGGYFIIVFTNVIAAVSHLQYIAISVASPTTATTNADIASSYISASSVSWNGYVVGNKLFIAYNTTTGGQQIKVTYLTSSLILAPPQSFAASIATNVSVYADITAPASPIIYVAFYDSAGSTGYIVAVDQNLNKRMTATQIIPSGAVKNITITAQGGVVTAAYEVTNAYSYDAAIPSNLLKTVQVTLPATVTTGSVGSTTTLVRSVGLASKAFLLGGTMYMLASYQSPLQPTYFLIDISGNVIGKIAYENGGGYLTKGLPQAQVVGTRVYIAYLYKDLIQSVATNGLAQSIGSAGLSNIYSQTGVNVATFDFSSESLSVSEIGSNLNISGGILWSYDGQTINEQGFHLFPDSIEAVWSATGGSIVAKPDGSTNTNAYYYAVTYEWTDAAGNIVRSAPSVPIGVTTTGSLSTGSITVNVPYLRLTYKTTVKIVIYRWSVANQAYYQVTSITAPQLNSTTSDSLAYVDTLADASIVGNSILYTTGGVVENIAAPAATATTLFDDRLWLIDAEDKNLLWFSKQVIEATPVEMSDLFTKYIAPSTGSQGSTGVMRCLSPLDDKLIIFKQDAIYYINGSGPDNTGSNDNYSQPIFITSTVGCSNQNSIVFTDKGLMFQSDKGIWLLGRDLQVSYIGADVEAFNSSTVTSAVNVPATTQVRFTLSTGEILMYDYFYGQWGTFVGAPAISSTLYQSAHTLINSSGAVLTETDGKYLDNGNPVLMSFKTSWINLAGLQGYIRSYFFYLLGTYLSPHRLALNISYDYADNPEQISLISPDNYSPNYGAVSPYGQQSQYGGPTNLEQWRVFLKKQRCQAMQIELNEIYDSSLGVSAGAGLTLSGINLIYSGKNVFRPISSARSVGAS